MNDELLEKHIQLTLFRKLPDIALFIFDHDLRYVFAEGMDLEKMGLAPEHIIGKTPREVLPPVHVESLEPLYTAALRGEESTVEGRYRGHFYKVQVSPFRDESGEIQGGIVVTRDVTRDKQIQKEQRERERRYRMLFEQTNDAVFIMSLLGVNLEVNRQAAEMFGYRVEELIGTSFRELVVEEEVEQSANVIERLLAGEAPPVYERVFRKKSGERLVAEVNVALVRDDKARPLYIQSVLRDVTSRKQREELLRESEQRYRILTDLISDFAYAYRLSPEGESELEWVTEDSFQRITGYRPEEIYSRGNFLLWHPQDMPTVLRQRQRVLQGEQVTDEHRLVTKSGDVRWMRVYRRPVFDANGNVIRFYGIAQDITERKEAELRQRDSEERYRIVSELMSDYAYAFNVDENGELASEWLTKESFIRVTGYLPDETDQIADYGLFHPLDRDRARQHQQDVLEGQITNSDYRIVTKNGEIRWVHIRRYPVMDESRTRVVRFYGVAQDITGRKEAEIALRRSEEFLTQTHQIAKVGGWELNLLSGELFWTQQTREIHEVAPDYVPRLEEAINFYAPEYRLIIQQAVEEASHGQPYDLELQCITATGRRIWVRTLGQAEIVNGSVVRLFGTFQDITDLKRAEIALRNNEERYRSLTELISDYAFSFHIEPDNSLVPEWVTDESYTRITGYTVEEVNQLKRTGLYHPDDRDQVEIDLQHVLRGEATSSQYRIITKSGEVRWLQIDRRPVWDEKQQRVVRFDGVAQDITDHKYAEEALLRSEERFRLIAQVSHDGLYDFDVIQDHIWLSNGYLRLLGFGEDYTQYSFLDLTQIWHERVHPENQPMMSEHVEQILNGKKSYWSIDYRFQKPHGGYIFISDRGYVIPDEHGRTERIVGAVTDITEQREAEKRTLELALAQEKMQIFASFITAISHDFRNPLAVINTSAYLIEKTDTPEERKRHLDKLKQQANHIEGLVDGLLTMSQLDNPNLFELTPLNINDLLTYIKIREENTFAERGIALEFDLAADLPQIYGDRNWLYRGLLNLIENARLYTSPGGKVDVRTTVIEDSVLIEVQDNGIGIEDGHLEHIFDPLFRAELHRPSSGQGLGLSITKKIIERHQGDILVVSEVDEGSTFCIMLPIMRVDHQEKAALT